MKKFLTLALAVLLPLSAFATTAVPWLQTNLTDTFITPAKVNGLNLGVSTNASSTFQSFTFTTATGTSATTTNFFATTASTSSFRADTGIIGFLTSVFGSFTNILANGSTTLQNFTGNNSTTSQATTTNLFVSNRASTTELRANIGTIGNLTSVFHQVTNLLAIGSSTLQNFTGVNATTSNATTTGLSAASFCLAGDCRTVWPSSSSYTVTYPIVLTGTTLSLAFSTTTNNNWGGQQTFLASTTLQSFTFTTATGTEATTTNLYISNRASTTDFRANTESIGFGTLVNLLVNGSTTLQNFTGNNATTSQATTTSLYVSSFASTTTFRANTATIGGSVGIASSTPFSTLSVGSGSITVAENKLSTSTSMTIDWNAGNQQLIQKGTAGITLTFSNVINGKKLTIVACNPPSGTGGTFTWPTSPTLYWPAGTSPTQTTTANKCDLFTFAATQATSSTASTIVLGGSNVNY